MLWITNNFIKHQLFVYTQLNDQTVLFQTIQLSISHLFKCQIVLFDPLAMTLSGATIPGQSEPGSNDNEEEFYFP